MAASAPQPRDLPLPDDIQSTLFAFGRPVHRASYMGRPAASLFTFVRAWRVLKTAAMRYRAGLITRKKLIDAEEQGQSLLGSVEAVYSRVTMRWSRRPLLNTRR